MTQPVVLDPSALERIKKIARRKNLKEVYFRISVLGGGCAGFQYHYDFVDTPWENDLHYAIDDIHILIDREALPFLNGAQLYFKDKMIGAAFKMENPLADAVCGCGSSFNVS